MSSSIPSQIHTKKQSGDLTHLPGLIESVEMSKIKSSKIPVRNDPGDILQLASSIKDIGLLHPIVVRISDDTFELIAGHRRYLACKKLGWRNIPSQIVEVSDKESFEISLVENVQRKTMNPIEEANAYQRYVKNFGWGGESELARRIGKSQEYVSKRIKLLELSPEVQNEIILRRINPSVAEEICYVKDKEDLQRLAKIATTEHLTVRKFREISKSYHEEIDEKSFPAVLDSESENSIASFDKAIIALRLAMRRVDDILSEEISFVIRDMMMCQRIMIHSQIDLLIRNKKKYSKLIKSNGRQWLK